MRFCGSLYFKHLSCFAKAKNRSMTSLPMLHPSQVCTTARVDSSACSRRFRSTLCSATLRTRSSDLELRVLGAPRSTPFFRIKSQDPKSTPTTFSESRVRPQGFQACFPGSRPPHFPNQASLQHHHFFRILQTQDRKISTGQNGQATCQSGQKGVHILAFACGRVFARAQNRPFLTHIT